MGTEQKGEIITWNKN